MTVKRRKFKKRCGGACGGEPVKKIWRGIWGHLGKVGGLEPQVILMGEEIEGKGCLRGEIWRDQRGTGLEKMG